MRIQFDGNSWPHPRAQQILDLQHKVRQGATLNRLERSMVSSCLAAYQEMFDLSKSKLWMLKKKCDEVENGLDADRQERLAAKC